MAFLDLGTAPRPLRGRDADLRVLHERVRATARGQSWVVLLEGAAGTGKSRLIFDAMVAATSLGVSSAGASADDQSLVSFSPLVTALGESMTSPHADVVDTRLWLLDRLRSNLEERVVRSPLVLALDDLHSAQSVTLHAVQSLVQQLSSYPLLWLLAGRVEAGQSLERCFVSLEAQGAGRIRLGPLSRDAVAEVIRDIVDAEPASQLLTLADEAGGNPQLVVELVEGLDDEDAIEVANGVAGLVSTSLPRRLQDIVSYRLRRLSPEATNLIEVASVLGSSFSVDDLAAVRGEPVGRLLPALDETQRTGILISVASGLSFRHGLVRSAVYDAIAEPIRSALHRQFGELLLQRGEHVVAAARHLSHAGGPADPEALAALDRAVAEIRVSSPEAAADLGLRALALTAPTDEDRFARTVVAVDSLMAAGRVFTATELARDTVAARDAPPPLAAQLRLTLSSTAFMSARHADALADAEAVLAETGLSDEVYAAAEHARLLALMAEGDFSEAQQPAESILAGGARSAGDAALAGALTALGSIAWIEGRLADALGLFRAAVRRADRGPLLAGGMHPRQSLAVVLAAAGEFDEAAALLVQDSREIDLTGDRAWAAAVLIRQSCLHLASGRLVDAVAEAEAGVALAEELRTPLFVPLGRSTLAAAALLRGDPVRANAEVERCRAETIGARSFPAIVCDWVEARIVYTQQGPNEAVELLADVYADPSANRRLLLEEPAAFPWLVRAALAARDHQRAEVVVGAVNGLAADNRDATWVAGIAAHARGLAEREPSALEEAVACHRHPWARATAMEDHGALLASSDPNAGRVQLEGALAAFEKMDAEGEAARVRATLRDVGARRRHETPGDRPAWGWASLTDSEREVAGLVAEGLTNRQVAERMFLSRHTVDFHLRQIFRKLAITSRVELTRQFLERRGAGDG
jgi:DNA-binding CsgD family transcriptional regulator